LNPLELSNLRTLRLEKMCLTAIYRHLALTIFHESHRRPHREFVLELYVGEFGAVWSRVIEAGGMVVYFPTDHDESVSLPCYICGRIRSIVEYLL
jgi:hypothetical protein